MSTTRGGLLAITHKRSEPLSLAPVSAYCRNTFIDRGEKTVEVGAAKKKKNDDDDISGRTSHPRDTGRAATSVTHGTD